MGDVRLACDRRQCVGDQGPEQPAASGLGDEQAPFESVAQRHQFVHLDDDTVLLG